MNKSLKIFGAVFLILFSSQSYATHIVGGEMNYTCLGGNNYEIRLKVYRDCANSTVPFDQPAYVGVFNASNTLVTTLQIPFTGSSQIPLTVNQTDPCFKPPGNVCVEATEYVTTVTLPPSPGGYTIAYQRCCRNNVITNLTNPGNQGATYSAYIPDNPACNSNPVYTEFPPLFVCQGFPILFDHSATDADGDSLVYTLCSPKLGGTLSNPRPTTPSAPPYANVNFAAPYNAGDPLGGSDPLTIDPITGILTGTAEQMGVFVIGVCVHEYRNGVLISTTSRDFQFNVVNCERAVVAAANSIVTNCNSYTVTFTNNSTGGVNYFWNFGDPTVTTDTITTTNTTVTYTYPGAGTYNVMLIAYSGIDPACNDTLFNFATIVDTCGACGMGLDFTKTDADCGAGSGPCTTSPPIIDTKSGKFISAGNPPNDSTVISWAHTVTPGGVDRLLVVHVAARRYNATSVTYAGIPLTLLAQSASPLTIDARTELWYLVAPPTGTNQVVVNFPPSSGTFYQEKRGQALSFTGVNQSAPFGTPTTANGQGCGTMPYTVVSGPDELVLDLFTRSDFYSPTVISGQTEEYNVSSSIGILAAGSTKPGASPDVTMGWNWTFCGSGTGDNHRWSAVAVSIKPSCGGGATFGSATVTPLGGTAPYTYTWNTTPPQSTPTISNLTAGIYTVTVVDASGFCSRTDSIIINSIGGVTVDATGTDLTGCATNDGTATATPSGGNGPYTYRWIPGDSTTASITNLPPGLYTVIVMDADSCISSDTITIIDPFAIPVVITDFTNVSCTGGSDGTAIVTPTGVAPFTYVWSNGGSTDSTITGLGGGTYTVTVTDATGCPGTTSVTISQPPPIDLTMSSDSVSCRGGSDGTATVVATGGTPASTGYTYLWTPGNGSTATIGSLSPGTYSVQVTDSLGCQNTATVNVYEPATNITPEPRDSSTIDCAGVANGIGVVDVSGGTEPITYLWCDGQTTRVATGLPAGPCSITVTDAKGCSETVSVDIVFPAPLSLDTLVTHVSCNGGTDGGILANPSGGAAPYTFAWTGGSTSQGISNLSAGVYTVDVTDAQGCIVSATITIQEPPAINITLTPTHVTCTGGNNSGSITTTVTGGNPGYTYSWAPGGQNTADISGLVAGTYTLTVTDANGCQHTEQVVIDSPNSPVIDNLTKQDASCNANDGEITVNASGGTAPYTYSINGGAFQSGNVFTGLAPGAYTVTVRDVNGCETTGNITIVRPGNPLANFTANPTQGQPPLNVVFTNNSGGTTFHWNFGNGTTDITTDPSGTLNTDYLTTGVYVVTLIAEENGCTDTMRITITVVPNSFVIVPNIFTPNGDGTNDRFITDNEGIESMSVQIYNRWGTLLYEITQPDGFWDGKGHPDGTYFYILKATGYDGVEYESSGHFMMKR